MATRRTIGRAAMAMTVVATMVLGPVAQAVAEPNRLRLRNAPGTEASRHPVAGPALTKPTSTEPAPVLTAVSTADVTSTVSTHTLSIDQAGGALALPYCGNGDVLSAKPAVHTVVVVVHGTNRNACDYARYVIESAALAGGLAGTLVVAPHFQADGDLTASDTTSLYWSDDGWKSGSRSLRSPFARPWSMSSYEALDRLIGTTADPARLPGLKNLVVAGHSAGGQFVNRYAASTRLSTSSGVAPRFVIANPSSYLYFDSRRSDGSRLRHLTAAESRACPDHDHYKYGLQHRYAFLAELDTATLKERYARSEVRYLLGDRDTSTTSSTLDTSCAARWQGAHRLQRGQRYYDLLDDVLGADVHDRHRLAVVPGVGHDGRQMFGSAAGRGALFG